MLQSVSIHSFNFVEVNDCSCGGYLLLQAKTNLLINLLKLDSSSEDSILFLHRSMLIPEGRTK